MSHEPETDLDPNRHRRVDSGKREKLTMARTMTVRPGHSYEEIIWSLRRQKRTLKDVI